MSYLGNQPGVGSFIVSTERFNGTGSCTQFTITQTGIQDANVVDIIVSNVPQDPINSYSIANGVITFTEAPPSGTQNIIVRYRATTVITYGNVAGNQILDGTITASKLAPGVGGDPAAGSYANSAFVVANGAAFVANTDYTGVSVSPGTYGSASAIPSITIAANGRVTAVTTAAASSDPLPNILMLSGM